MILKRLLYRNFRLIYRSSHWLRHRFTPAGLLVLGTCIASGIFGVNTHQTLAYQIFAFTAACLLLSTLWTLGFRQPFRVVRHLPDYGTALQPLRYRVEIFNPGDSRQEDLCLLETLDGGFPAFEEFISYRDPEDRHRNWFDRQVGYPRLMGLIHRRRGAAISPVPMPSIAPRDHTQVEMEILPLRRGFLRFDVTRLGRPDPLGLFRALRTQSGTDKLLILPRLYRVPHVQLAGRRRYQRGGMTLASVVGDSQEFISLRDYKPGDPLRAIHWRSFARTGKPVVREYQDEFFVRQGLLLDTALGDRPPSVFEEAVSVAASFAVRRHDEDALIDLMFAGESVHRVTSGRGLGRVENLLEVLACVGPGPESGLVRLTDVVTRHLGESSGLICIFLDWDANRRRIVEAALVHQVPVYVIVVTDDPARVAIGDGALAAHPERFVVLPLDGIQSALDGAMHTVIAA